MKVLITGGAGFIGSTVASACLDAGICPVILDNLATGRREFAAGRAFYAGDIADGLLIDRIFAEHPDIYAVVHCAALIVVARLGHGPLGVLAGERGQEPRVRGAPAAEPVRTTRLQFFRGDLPGRR